MYTRPTPQTKYIHERFETLFQVLENFITVNSIRENPNSGITQCVRNLQNIGSSILKSIDDLFYQKEFFYIPYD